MTTEQPDEEEWTPEQEAAFEAAFDKEMDAEWERINALSIEDLDAELKAAGIDPEVMVREVKELFAKLDAQHPASPEGEQ